MIFNKKSKQNKISDKEKGSFRDKIITPESV